MKYVVGIDVSKNKLDVVWLRDTGALKVKTKVISNTPKGHQALSQWLVKNTHDVAQDIRVVMEATSIYHEALAYYLHEVGFEVCVVNPAQIKSYANSLGTTHKTDKKDGLIIARFGATQSVDLWQPEPAEIRELKALLARLESLEKDIQREHNRLEKSTFGQSSTLVIDSIQKIITELNKEKKRLEAQIDDHINRHPKLRKDRTLLESIPGIGPVLSRTMLSVIHSRSFQSASQLAAFLGVIPKIVESGVFKGRSAMTKQGPGHIRAKLYMAAISASRYNPQVKAQKQRLLANGKNKMQALGAAMRKLVHLCFGVIKQQTEYNPQANRWMACGCIGKMVSTTSLEQFFTKFSP